MNQIIRTFITKSTEKSTHMSFFEKHVDTLEIVAVIGGIIGTFGGLTFGCKTAFDNASNSKPYSTFESAVVTSGITLGGTVAGYGIGLTSPILIPAAGIGAIAHIIGKNNKKQNLID